MIDFVLRIAIVRILSYGLEYIQKSTFNYFNLVFPGFSPNLPDFFSTELYPSRGISNKKKKN
jgi:hypothetical protein